MEGLMTVKSLGEQLRLHIAEGTGRPCGLNEVPENATMPFFNIRPLPSGDMDGSLGKPNTDEDQAFTIDTVGVTQEQIDEAEHRMLMTLSYLHQSLATVMGPPRLRRNGSGREDDRTYRAMVIATIPVTAT